MMLLYLWDISELCIFIFSDTEANGLASGDSQNSPLHGHKRTSDKREVLCFQAGCGAWNYCVLPPASDCRWERRNVKAGALPTWPVITTYKCPFWTSGGRLACSNSLLPGPSCFPSGPHLAYSQPSNQRDSFTLWVRVSPQPPSKPSIGSHLTQRKRRHPVNAL